MTVTAIFILMVYDTYYTQANIYIVHIFCSNSFHLEDSMLKITILSRDEVLLVQQRDVVVVSWA